jgi:hypothetical protein
MHSHRADRPGSERSNGLFTKDARFVLYMDAKSDIPSQEFQHLNGLGPAFDNLNRYEAATHFNDQSTVVLDSGEATGVSYCLAHHVFAALGRPLEVLVGEGWLKSRELTLREGAKAKWYNCIRTRIYLDVIWRFRVYDGTYRWQHLRAEPSSMRKAATPASTWWVDVDEQFKARGALQASVRLGRYWTVCRR